MTDIDLDKSLDGVYEVPDISSCLDDIDLINSDFNFPDVGALDGEIRDLESQVAIEQIKMVKGARAIQEGAATLKFVQQVVDMNTKIKEEEGNDYIVRISAGTGWVDSVQVTPFWKMKKHSIKHRY